jgi:hypothetical protein
VINLALWALGIALLAVAVWRARPAMARMAELDRLADNARRYETWRGGSRTAANSGETTGADIMRGMLRRQVYLWAAIGVLGVVLIVAGFAVR